VALAEGAALRLMAIATHGGGGTERAAELTGLFREALAQTERFDLAAGTLDGPAANEIHVQADLEAATLTATLRRDGEPPVPLAAAPFRAAAPHDAIDALAVAVRQALGESVPAWPISSALTYSADPEAVRQGELGWDRYQRGDFGGAQTAFERGRRRDGGCPILLTGLVACATMSGDHATAERLALEALEYGHRLHAPATHRLTRALLLARAARQPANSRPRDEDLLRFGQVGHRERPHDVEPRISQAMAHNLLGDYPAAAEILRPLHVRLPEHALVGYHLAYAELALDEPLASLAAIESVGNRLPLQATALPKALALYHSHQHEALRDHFDRLARQRGVRDGPALHEIRRMQAAHAILTEDRARAIEVLLEDIQWLRDHPSMLAARAMDLAQAGEVLVRLGAHRELGAALRGFDDLGQLPAPTLDSLVFLGGLVECATTGDRALSAEASLSRRSGALEVWGNIVKAYGHHQRGELADEASALSRAAEFSDAPLIKAALGHAWLAMGRKDEAQALLGAVRREQFTFDLRLPERHPLLNPATALACL